MVGLSGASGWNGTGEAEGHLTPGANISFVDKLDELTSSAAIRIQP
jgi:hypothetical protein